MARYAALLLAASVAAAGAAPLKVDDAFQKAQENYDAAKESVLGARHELSSVEDRLEAARQGLLRDAAFSVGDAEGLDHKADKALGELVAQQLDTDKAKEVHGELEEARALEERIRQKQASLGANADTRMVEAVKEALRVATEAREAATLAETKFHGAKDAMRTADIAGKKTKALNLESVESAQSARDRVGQNVATLIADKDLMLAAVDNVLIAKDLVRNVQAARSSVVDAMAKHDSAITAAVDKLQILQNMEKETDAALQKTRAANKVAEEIYDAEKAVKKIKVAKEAAKVADAASAAAEADAQAAVAAAHETDFDLEDTTAMRSLEFALADN